MAKSVLKRMIRNQLEDRDIDDPRVLKAFQEVDRALFVPDELKESAYDDRPLPIGSGQTISQPYIVAYMAQVLDLSPSEVVLEIGTGCGYNAAILSRLVKEVYSVEIFSELTWLARENLDRAGIDNVYLKTGDGHAGWPEKSPFDAIVLTAAPSRVPEGLLSQLRVGGRLLAPVGEGIQNLFLYRRLNRDNYDEQRLLPVQFVPLLHA